MLSKANDSPVEYNNKDLKFKIGDHVRMSKKMFLQRAALQIGLRKSL